MIYLTGDTHGDFHRFSTKRFPEQKQMTRNDHVIILGDFGGLFNGTAEEEYWLNWLSKKNFTLLFLDGNHENFDLLEQYPLIQFHGGLTHQIRENIYHLCRGQVFHLEDKDFFVMGGAESHDSIILHKDKPISNRLRRLLRMCDFPMRVEGINWWPQELPDLNEQQRSLWKLEKRKEDFPLYILSHCGPTHIQRWYFPSYPDNSFTDFLMSLRFDYPDAQWFCGHYHVNQCLDEERIQILYDKIIPIY